MKTKSIQPSQFTSDELSFRLECLKLAAASVHSAQSHSIPWLADKFYTWLALNDLPTENELSDFKSESDRLHTTSLVFDPMN